MTRLFPVAAGATWTAGCHGGIRLRATKARELLHQLQQWPAFGEARSGSAASAFKDKSRPLPPAKPKMTSLALFNLSVEQYPPYQDQSQNPLRAEEASRA